jgi:uncharacterized membrane protein YphA (DoxX/SURF4 family)
MTVTERTSTRDSVIALLRIALGAVFIFASVEKVADPTAFTVAINGYKIVSSGPALIIATILPWMELLCGLGMILGVFVRGSALLALCMLNLFSVAVIAALWRGLDISCGCYTQDPTAERIGWWKLGENLVLIGMSFLVFRRSSSAFTLEHYLQNRSCPMHTKV